MIRLLPEDVVNAYRATNMIPIRLAWTTNDERGGCAIDTLARHRGCDTDTLRQTLDPNYETGFLAAWDADDPHAPELIEELKSRAEEVKQGYCDGILARQAVSRVFSSELIPVYDNVEPADES